MTLLTRAPSVWSSPFVGADDVVDANALGAVLAVVAGAVMVHTAQRFDARIEECLPGMVLVADDVAEVRGMFDEVADHAHVAPDGVGADDADAVEPGAVDCLEVMAEQLVQAADHQHRHAIRGEAAQVVGAGEQVVGTARAAWRR